MNLNIPVNENDQKQGNANAPIVFLEYGDYECPYCGAAYPVIKKLQKHFGENLLFVFRNFPIAESHPHAVAAACAAEAAALQHKFWRMHDLLYENQRHMETPQLLQYAKQAGADAYKLELDMSAESILNKVEGDFESGVRSGVNGTPSFYINGKKFEGNYDYNSLKEALEEKLQKEKSV